MLNVTSSSVATFADQRRERRIRLTVRDGVGISITRRLCMVDNIQCMCNVYVYVRMAEFSIFFSSTEIIRDKAKGRG